MAPAWAHHHEKVEVRYILMEPLENNLQMRQLWLPAASSKVELFTGALRLAMRHSFGWMGWDGKRSRGDYYLCSELSRRGSAVAKPLGEL